MAARRLLREDFVIAAAYPNAGPVTIKGGDVRVSYTKAKVKPAAAARRSM
jgi:hypothetical protein